jgi:hypothetical protein
MDPGAGHPDRPDRQQLVVLRVEAGQLSVEHDELDLVERPVEPGGVRPDRDDQPEQVGGRLE